MIDPQQTYIDVTVELGRDVTLFPGTLLQGSTVVAAGSEIGPSTTSWTPSWGPARWWRTASPTRPRSARALMSDRTRRSHPGR